MKEIHTTTEYGIFKHLTGNRELKKRAEDIKKSIGKIGWITNPIIVNENMEVIDGQSRLQALMELGMPVEYIIQDSLDLEQCRTMNSYNESWGTKDYIDSYCAEGNENYIRLRNLMETFGVRQIRIALSACGISAAHKKELREGLLVLEPLAFGKDYKRLSLLNKFEKVTKRFGGRNITKAYALFYISDYEYVDMDYLYDALEKCNPNDVYTDSIGNVIKSYQKAYNYNRLKKNRAHFYEDYMKERS